MILLFSAFWETAVAFSVGAALIYTATNSVGAFPFLHILTAAAAAKLLQSCPTLCDPIDGSPPGSPVPGILQARTLEWVANSFSNAWKWKVKVKLLSRVRLLVTPRTAAYQAPPSMGFSRQEYWSGVPLSSPPHPHRDLLFVFFLMIAFWQVWGDILLWGVGLIRRRQWHPTLVLLPRKSHGRRSLVRCSPWGR